MEYSPIFILFASAVSTTLFPEMSELSTKRDPQAVANLVEDALSYAGLLLIPGLVGGVILGERILRIYGGESTQGASILIILILANLIMSYQNQVLNTLNAVNRPDLSFRANALFILANILLNITLIYFYGWIGAAVATTLSVIISLGFASRYLKSIIDFSYPWTEISRQGFAALLMGAFVYFGLWIEETYRLLSHNFGIVLTLVTLGAGIYFAVYFVISSSFRTTIARNIPFEIPFL